MMMAQILRPHLRSASVIPNRMKMGPYLGVIRTRMMSTHKSKRNIREYYGLLYLDEGCSADDVRESFRKLTKQYHPDGGSSTADSTTIIRIE